MRHMRVKEGGMIFCAAALFSALSLLFLWRDGFLAEQLSDWRTEAMLAELLLLWGLFLLADRAPVGTGARRGAVLLLSCGFLWLHRALLPVLLSGLWVLGLVCIGEALLLPARKRGGALFTGAMRLSHDFLLGSAFYMTELCLISAFRTGGVGISRWAALLSSLFALCLLFRAHVSGALRLPLPRLPREEAEGKAEGGAARRSPVRLSVLTLLLLHAGRMNITLDYDSLRYGLRSAFVLDSGGGVFQNLGTVNAVYFYPKGLELLTLPLSGSRTHGFVLAFSLWCAALMLLVLRDLAARFAGERAGLHAMLLAACIPGIMNLSTSAKTDMITLLFQLVFLNDFLFAVRKGEPRRRRRALLWGLCSLLMTLTLKPTAVVFSGGLLLAALIFLITQKETRAELSDRRDAGPLLRDMLIPAALSMLAFSGVTLRSLHLTGYPLVSVFTGLWEQLGFRGKYPLAAQEMPNAAAGLEPAEQGARLLKRLFLLLIAPTGEEGLHIRIAWGSGLFALCLLCILIFGRKRGALPEGFRISLLFLLSLDLISVRLLHQLDGNYYNLSYSLAAAGAVCCMSRRGESALRSCLPAALTAVFFMCLTNWSGSRGFTEPKLRHGGFYDHSAEARDYMILSAKEPIYRYCANGPLIRMLAMSDAPECYLFPCRVESYSDLEGSGGNVGLVKTLDLFKEYLEFAGISRLYTEDEFLEQHGRAEEIIRYLREDGSVTQLISQEGNTLYEYHAGMGN